MRAISQTQPARITPIYVNGPLTAGASIGVGLWQDNGGTPAATTDWWAEGTELVLRAPGYTGLFTEADMAAFSLKTLHGWATGAGTSIPTLWRIYPAPTGTNMRLTKNYS
jgi:hypothetical protein